MIVGVDAQLDKPDDAVQYEDIVVSEAQNLLPAGSQEQIHSELNDILRRFGLQTRLLVVERANSLALLFSCMTLSAIMNLRDQWRSRQLRDTVQKLFTFLSGATGTVYVKRLTWPVTDYHRCLEFFTHAKSTGKQTYHIMYNLAIVSCPSLGALWRKYWRGGKSWFFGAIGKCGGASL